MNDLQKDARTLVLLSGGPDSATLLELINRKREAAGGGVVNALYLKTGRPADENEIKAAKEAIEAIGGELEVVDISDVVSRMGGSGVMMHAGAEIATFGNTLVLSIAKSIAAANRYDTVAFGLHKDDAYQNYEYSGEYISKFEALVTEIDSFGPEIVVPFSDMTKRQVFELGKSLGVDFSKTWSCIEGRALHCGTCGACLARSDAMRNNGILDRTKYAVSPDIGTIAGPYERAYPSGTIANDPDLR